MTVADHADLYIADGWELVRIQKGEKQPSAKWKQEKPRGKDFGPDGQLAFKCGAPSGHRICLDVDCTEVLALLPKFISTKLMTRPKIVLLEENNVRQGFFEQAQFEGVLKHLPDDLKPIVTFAYITGWRVKSEVLPLEWHQVDFKAGTVRLEPGTTKNKEGRTFPMTKALRTLLEAQHVEREALKKRRVPIANYRWVFFRMVANGRGGPLRPMPIKSFGKAFKTACRRAGVPGRIPHDFRRTAVRNLERAGVPRSVAMRLVGHKTESVYRRYAIADERDLRVVVERLDMAASG
jgi:integrase